MQPFVPFVVEIVQNYSLGDCKVYRLNVQYVSGDEEQMVVIGERDHPPKEKRPQRKSNMNNNLDNNYKFECKKCGNKYKNKKILCNHVNYYCGDKAGQYPCPLCKPRCNLKRHLLALAHKNSVPKQCVKCGNVFKTWLKFVEHLLDKCYQKSTGQSIKARFLKN